MGDDFRRSAAGRRQSWFGLKRLVKSALSHPAAHAVMRTVVRFVPSVDRGRLPAPATVREVTGQADGATYVMLRPDRCEIAKELYWGRGRRPRPADALAVDVMARLARDAQLFVDVGAYTGLFTLIVTAVNPDIRAHAFEIVPAVADHLDANLVRNGASDRVAIHRVAVGAPDQTMRVPAGDDGSALPSFYSTRMTFTDGVDVPFDALDRLFGDVPSQTRVLIKIDVEGTEDEVLEHGTRFLTRPRIDVLCEVLAGVANEGALNRIVSAAGLRLYLVREQDLYPAASIRANARYRDWLFTKRTPDELRSMEIAVAEV
jgi:FkbM family methyltransferase